MENSYRPTSVQIESHFTNAEDNTLTPELRDKVFKNELIRDRIFDYIFTTDNVHFRTCGLVEKDWLEYLIRRIERTSVSFDLSFEYWEQSKEEQKRKGKKYQVHKFIETWASFPGAGSRVPFFNLQFTGSSNVAMKNDKVQALSNCLVRCGNGLHRLAINLACISDEVSDTIVNLFDSSPDLGQLYLPNLTDLHAQLPEKHAQVVVALLLAPILSGCKRLRVLSLKVPCPYKVSVIRFISAPGCNETAEYLPDTLEEIKCNLPMTPQLLSNLLLKNSLPNLTEVQLNIEGNAGSTDNVDVVYHILDKFSHQLKVFVVQNVYGKPKNDEIIKFPLMTKLKELSVVGFHSEPKHGTEQPFPVLETLCLTLPSSSMMQKWIKKFQFKCLHVLYVGIYNAEFTLGLSQQLHVSFPHLQELHINCSDRMGDGSMQNIFQHMTQLRVLFIKTEGRSEIVGASIWDAILLGVSPEYARNLAESPQELWDSVNLSHFRPLSWSIVNLSNLTRFSLTSSESGDMDEVDLLISDVSFHFAFLCMPTLHCLTLENGFGASKEMVEEWKRRGRTFFGYVHDDDEWEDIDSSVSEE